MTADYAAALARALGIPVAEADWLLRSGVFVAELRDISEVDPESLVAVDIFTHRDPTTSPPTVIHLNVTAMLADVVEAINGAQPQRSADAIVTSLSAIGADLLSLRMDPAQAEWHVRAHGVDVEKARALTAEQLTLPVVGIAYGPEYTVTVDGNHRLVGLWLRGDERFLMARFRDPDWRRYLIDLPPEESARLAAELPPDTVPPPPEGGTPA